jgi:Tol biopolymer transport system component
MLVADIARRKFMRVMRLMAAVACGWGLIFVAAAGAQDAGAGAGANGVAVAAASSTATAATFSGPAPEIFAPGVISGPANDGSPTFSPDGKTLYFTRSTAAWGVILESREIGGKWSEPVVAPFSGEWRDSSPGFSPDGSFLVFVSLRPEKIPGPGEKITSVRANLYRVKRSEAGWSEAERLPDAVNIGNAIWKPSVAADGTIYFVSIDAQGGKRLYRSRLKDGIYQQAEPLSFSDGTTADVDPEIAPDGSFLVFCSSGRVKDDPRDHLYIVRRSGDGWGAVTAMRYAGDMVTTDDEPHLGGVDRRTVYFSSDRAVPVKFPRTHEQAVEDLKRLELWDNSNSNVWFMSLGPWLEGKPKS